MDSLVQTLYPLALQIATPMALAGTTILLFFSFMTLVIKSIGPAIERMGGRAALAIIITLSTYGFILAGIALAGALISYGFTYLFEDEFKKSALIEAGNRHIAQQEPSSAVETGQQLVAGWPRDVSGYRIRGAGYFMAGKFPEAASDFRFILSELYRDLKPCDLSSRNITANLIAAEAASGHHDDALNLFDTISKCDLEKGMRFNEAKLLMVTGRYDAAIGAFQKIADDKGFPPLADRALFSIGITHILANLPTWQDQAILSFKKSICINNSYRDLILSQYPSTGVDPPGALVQLYDEEIEAIRKTSDTNFQTRLIAALSEDATCQTK